MNIIIVNDYGYVNGGAGQVAINSALALAQWDHNVILFTAVGPVDEKLYDVENLTVICLQQNDILNDPNRLRASLNGIWNKYASDNMVRLLTFYNPHDTIIHIHTCCKSLSASIVRAALKRKFKVVYHLHDYGIACPNLAFYNYQQRKLCKVDPLSMKCFTSNCDVRSYIHKVWRCLRQVVQIHFGGLPREVKHYVGVSDFSLQLIKPFLPEDAKIYSVRNPIMADLMCERVDVTKNSYFVFVGRLTDEKNPVLLANAARKLQLPVVFVGDGPWAEKVKQICPQAIVTGWVTPEKVQQYVRGARALVLTSVLYETQALVVLEAAVNGIPSIVPNTSAATEFVTNEKTGFYFASGSQLDLEEKLLKLCEDEVVDRLGREAYAVCRTINTTMEHHVAQLEGMYQEILRQ
jgi:glycosyltransferase involved in cell wall biosynthesis